ncbi:MAG: hypothetical protein ACKPKO_05750, partial [Candidatus Fonsibacter sp.]
RSMPTFQSLTRRWPKLMGLSHVYGNDDNHHNEGGNDDDTDGGGDEGNGDVCGNDDEEGGDNNCGDDGEDDDAATTIAGQNMFSSLATWKSDNAEPVYRVLVGRWRTDAITGRSPR